MACDSGLPKNICGKLPIADPIVQAWTNPCSAMGPRIKPNTIGDAENPNRETNQPNIPSVSIMTTSDTLLRIA